MNRLAIRVVAVFVLLLGCSRHKNTDTNIAPAPTGTTLSISSGDKQIGTIGSPLGDPLVVQANDAQNNGTAGVEIHFDPINGVRFDPESGKADSNGQLSALVSLGSVSGRYKIRAVSIDKSGKQMETSADAIALGYEESLGRELDNTYCSRCHNSESSPERVSNYDNLTAKPHAFTDGDSLNKISDADIELIISHGGPALNRSAEMPAYGYTLKKNEIRALISYIRAISDPPYRTTGVTYATH